MRCKSLLTVFAIYFAMASIASAQSTINLLPGDSIANGNVIAAGTTVNVLGGNIGLGVDQSNGTLNIESGNVAVGASSIGTGFTNSNNLVNISGGTVGGFFQLLGNTTLNLSGGQMESFGVFNSGTRVNITGGTVTRFPDIFDGVVNISGGDIFSIRIFGGEVNLIGSEFSIDGVEIDLAVGQTMVINQRNVNLSGILADGSPIETDLNSSAGGFNSANPDGASFAARVTVTVVEPEPIIGDVNQDDTVNFLDISPFISVLSASGFQDEADINRDEEVNFLDISPFIGLLQ